MSQNALRYRNPERVSDISEYRRLGNPEKKTKHHQPPRHPDNIPRIINVDERHHRAFHILFGNPSSIDTCIYILKRDWGL